MSELKVYHHELRPDEYAEYYLKYEADNVIADKDREIAKLKADNADLRDDKESTDAILDERNAEIAKLQAVIEERDKTIDELKEKLQAEDKQIENLINSASSIMLFQDRVNDNKCAELRHQKYKRCLAMARCCNRMFSSTFGKERYWQKWNRRWLELAEKFKDKEAK
jgi:septal ring factor EnvC (AmiA/AmiB activator)